MEVQMNIDGEAVRALRERKSWSQEHLASAAGLSVRTIQRVEVENVASAETRLAIAAALGVPVADLMPAPSTNDATVKDAPLPPPAVAHARSPLAGTAVLRNTLLGLAIALGFVVAVLVVFNVLSNFLPRS